MLIVHVADFFRPETQPTHHQGTEAAAVRSRHDERPKGTRLQPQSSEQNHQLGSELNRTARTSCERREHERSDRAFDHSRHAERPKDTRLQLQSSGHNRLPGSSHGSETRSRNRSSSERRDHGRSDRASDDYYEGHSSRKRMRDSSPMYGDKQSSRRSRDSSRSMTREEDASDDECNFKRRWGRRSSVAVDTRH